MRSMRDTEGVRVHRGGRARSSSFVIIAKIVVVFVTTIISMACHQRLPDPAEPNKALPAANDGVGRPAPPYPGKEVCGALMVDKFGNRFIGQSVGALYCGPK